MNRLRDPCPMSHAEFKSLLEATIIALDILQSLDPKLSTTRDTPPEPVNYLCKASEVVHTAGEQLPDTPFLRAALCGRSMAVLGKELLFESTWADHPDEVVWFKDEVVRRGL
jgi:hypothetical protein